jgi:Leucine-rich repeat (LRR) protein
LDNLVKINLSNNKIKNLPSRLFCYSKKLESLDLSSNVIETLNPVLFHDLVNLESINLSKNEINHLPDSLFFYSTKLVSIDLSINLIKKIESLVFKNLECLKVLDLYSNQIEIIEEDLFKDLVGLEELILVGNKLKTIENKTFDNMRKLESLELSGNKLQAFGSRLIKNLTNLKTINLAANSLRSLDYDLFHSTRELISIRLGSNSFKVLDSRLFAGLSELKFIDLNNCGISVIEASTFHGLRMLKSLDLHSNLIEILNPDLFRDLVNLQDINLENNKIQYLSSHIFSVCEGLVNINLKSNNLQYFDWKILSDLVNLEKVNLGINQLRTINDTNAFFQLSNRKTEVNLYRSMKIDLITLFNDLFFVHKENWTIALNDCIKCGSFILHTLSKTNDSLNVEEIRKTILGYSKKCTSWDYIVQNMNLSPTFLLNLITMLQTSITNNSIEEINNNSICLKQVGTFVKLCSMPVSVELLDYMLRKNKSDIKHDFSKYFEIALEQDNQEMGIVIVKYQLKDKEKWELIDSLLWKKFYEKRWWIVFEQILENFITKDENNLKYKFDLLEYVPTINRKENNVTKGKDVKKPYKSDNQQDAVIFIKKGKLNLFLFFIFYEIEVIPWRFVRTF